MDIGIGLPSTIPGVKGGEILEWAKRADAGPFSSLSIIDRLVYSNYEPLTTLAAASGATQRIGLLSSVLLAPLRESALLAKQVATLDALSGGRLHLGIGVGGRESDYAAAEQSYRQRGQRLDEQLALMKRVWAGEPLTDQDVAIGPEPAQSNGPPLLFGGFGPATARRIAQWGDGYIGTVVDPTTAAQIFGQVEAGWQAAGRPGRPRFVMCLYYALGPEAEQRGGEYIRHYYAFDPPMAELIAGHLLTTPDAVQGAIQGYRDVGVDELCFWPTIAELDQQKRLEDAIR